MAIEREDDPPYIEEQSKVSEESVNLVAAGGGGPLYFRSATQTVFPNYPLLGFLRRRKH